MEHAGRCGAVIYCIDTSSLIAAWSERYPIKHFPGFWNRLDQLILDGRLLSPDEVKREITKKSDGLWDWVKARKGLFVELDLDVQKSAREVLKQFPELTKHLPDRNSADPFVIALARCRRYTVVTEESPGGSPKRPRIPLVCAHYDVAWLNLLQLVQAENWVI